MSSKVFSMRWQQSRARRAASARVAGLLVLSLLVLWTALPARAQVNKEEIRRLGAGGLSQEQRYQALAGRTDEMWNHSLKTLKDFIAAHNPELALPVLQKELDALRTQAKEVEAPVMIRHDVKQLRQEIDNLMKGGFVTAARQDIAAKAQLLQAALGRLEEELDAIVRACALTALDSFKWEKEYVLSIQVQGEDVARRELKNQGVKACDKLEIARESYKKNRLPATPRPQSRDRPADLGELSMSQLQALLAQEKALPVPDNAWVREISGEIKGRLFATSNLEKFQETEEAAEKEKAEKGRAEQSKSQKKDAGKRSPRAP